MSFCLCSRDWLGSGGRTAPLPVSKTALDVSRNTVFAFDSVVHVGSGEKAGRWGWGGKADVRHQLKKTAIENHTLFGYCVAWDVDEVMANWQTDEDCWRQAGEIDAGRKRLCRVNKKRWWRKSRAGSVIVRKCSSFDVSSNFLLILPESKAVRANAEGQVWRL